MFWLLALLLSACAGKTTPAPAAAATPTTQPKPTTAPIKASGPAECTVVSPKPTPSPTEQSLFRPVGNGDRVLGPDTAGTTIIEYSDFQ